MNFQGEMRPKMVETAAELKTMVSRLVEEDVIACDLEADSLHHYREKVCLIQLATSREVFLVDPLALSDLSPLAPVFSSRAIRKVFHGADYDIRSLYRDFSMPVVNLFDTMIACQLLGEKEFGLAAVLRKHYGAELDKKYQKADWSKRPLGPAMIAYAAADTSYLVDLYRRLERELKNLGRLSWVEEESEILSEVRAVERNGEPFFVRFKGAGKLNPRTLAILEELLRFRDEKARALDRPPFKVLANETLRLLAEKQPRHVQELQGITGLTTRLVERYGDDILLAVAAGCALPDELLPRIRRQLRPARDQVVEDRINRLKRWREMKSAALGIDAGLMLNNALLESLALGVADDARELDGIPSMRNWQKEQFGREIVGVLTS
jgi:ribonuclease D